VGNVVTVVHGVICACAERPLENLERNMWGRWFGWRGGAEKETMGKEKERNRERTVESC